MIDREEEMILESGDYFVVHWQKPYSSYGGLAMNTRNFIFEKDKDEFVSTLLADKSVTSIEVGTYVKIK